MATAEGRELRRRQRQRNVHPLRATPSAVCCGMNSDRHCAGRIDPIAEDVCVECGSEWHANSQSNRTHPQPHHSSVESSVRVRLVLLDASTFATPTHTSQPHEERHTSQPSNRSVSSVCGASVCFRPLLPTDIAIHVPPLSTIASRLLRLELSLPLSLLRLCLLLPSGFHCSIATSLYLPPCLHPSALCSPMEAAEAAP